MNVFLLLAAVLCALTTFIHCYFGSKYVVAPLLRAADVHDTAKYTNYYCWHLVTATLVVMSASFLWAALSPAAIEVAIIAQILAITFMIWSISLVLWKKLSFRRMPQWLMFAAIAVMGGIGLIV